MPRWWANGSYLIHIAQGPVQDPVSLWRKLKKVGAVNLQQSVWLLPDSKENFALFGEIKRKFSATAVRRLL